MSIRKQYLKSKPVCKATFRIPEEKVISTPFILVIEPK
jgi:hypothetical protein